MSGSSYFRFHLSIGCRADTREICNHANRLPFFLIQLHHGQSFRTFKTLGDLLRRLLYYFTVSHSPWKIETLLPPLDRFYLTGNRAFDAWMLLLLLPFVAMLLVGAVRSVRRECGSGLFAGYAFVSLLMLILASRFVFLFEPRYSVGFLPAFCILTGLGLSVTWEWKKPVAVLAGAWMALLSGVALVHLYADPAYHKPDWRTYGEMVSERATSEDAVLQYTMGAVSDFLYYYKGSAPTMAVLPDPEGGVMPVVKSEREIENLLDGLGRPKRIWMLDCMTYMYDPEGIAPRVLSRRGRQVEHHFVREEMGFALRLYEMNQAEEGP